MAATGLRLAPWKRNVDFESLLGSSFSRQGLVIGITITISRRLIEDKLVDRKMLPNGVDSTDTLQHFSQPARLKPVDFNIEILRLDAEKPVAHRPADEHRPSSGVA